MEHLSHNTSPSPDEHTVPETRPALEKEGGFLSEIVRFGLLALIIVLPIRIFIAQPFIVSGESMEDTFHSGEYLIVDQLSYRFEEPARGDIIIFRYPKDPSKYFIKRVIGLPGETVRISGTTITITSDENPEGITLTEPYIHAMRNNPLSETTLGDDEYFVMGDNRDRSSDSRIWGTLPRENIIGRAYVRLSPFSRIDLLPGAYSQN